MLYYLFNYLDKNYNIPGTGLFEFLTFRAALAIILSLFIATFFGKRIIRYLARKQIGESVRDLGLEGQNEKAGTPTMGGLIIILATLVPVLLIAKLENIYVIMLIVTTVWMGIIGFIDDYIKKFKNDKEGLPGKFKVVGQVGLGLFIGLTMYLHPDIVVHRTVVTPTADVEVISQHADGTYYVKDKAMLTTIPFVKKNEFKYSWLINWVGNDYKKYVWLIFIPIAIFIITAVSNGANLTDGIDGLAAGSSAIIALTLAIFAWVSGNLIFSNYLNIMYIPNTGEMTIFITAFVGALIGFLWYNAYPAQVFMGDTGSLTIDRYYENRSIQFQTTII